MNENNNLVNKITNAIKNIGKKVENTESNKLEPMQIFEHGVISRRRDDPNSGEIRGSSYICVGKISTYSSNGDKRGVWSTSDESIATITSKGVLSAIAKGEINVKYSVTKGNRTEYTLKPVTVNPVLIAGTINGDSSVCVGSTTTFTSTGDVGGKWSSNDVMIAAVNEETGLVTGISKGSTLIIYTVNNMCGASKTSKLITVNPVLTAGTINGDSSVCVESTTTYTTTGDENGVWNSSNNTIATIESDGLITGISEGEVSITYTVLNMCGTDTAEKLLTVNPLLFSGTINGSDYICAGSTSLYTTTGNPGGTWSTSDTSIATIDFNGVVTGISEGDITIKYTVSNMCGSASSTKIISVKPLFVIEEINGDTSIYVGETTIYTNESQNGDWSSSNTNVAIVDQDGLVTGIAKGGATITYTVTDICGVGIAKKDIVVKEKDRVLFVLKNNAYPEYAHSFGLYNSSKMIIDYLEKTGNVCKIVTVTNTNSIQDEVYNFDPTIVIFEALWISGSDIQNLLDNPDFRTIKWIIRIHSNIGFLAAEPWAFKYIQEYINLDSKKVIVSCNNREFVEELSKVCNFKFKYLPDIMTSEDTENLEETVKSLTQNDVFGSRETKEILHIGSFGALRVLKNQLFQAMCAILAADRLDMTLHFHINGAVDDSHNPVLLNMKELFEINGKHKLVLHDWLENSEFNELIKQMDMGLQLSYTESFNIVTADFVFNEIPILVSETIDWMPRISMVSDVDYDNVVNKIVSVYNNQSTLLLKINKFYLFKYNTKAKLIWNTFIK